MLQNSYFFAKIGADTAENEQHFDEILPIGLEISTATRRRRARADEMRYVAAYAADIADQSFGLGWTCG